MSNLEIRFLPSEKIAVSAWDQLVFEAENASMYAYTWYLDMVAEDWSAIVLGDYDVVLPLVHRKKYGIQYIFPPAWTQQLGFISRRKIDEACMRSMLQAIPKQFKYISLLLNSSNPKLELKGTKTRNNFLLPIPDSEEELRKKYSSQTKRNLKKAEKEKLQFFANERPEMLIDLFKQNKGKEIKAIKDQSYLKLKHLMYASMHKGIGKVYSVYGPQNDLQASAFVLSYFQQSIFLFSGLNQWGRESGAMTYLIHQVLKERLALSHVFDFEGSDDKNLARFYSGFGAENFPYQEITINRLPFPLNLLKR